MISLGRKWLIIFAIDILALIIGVIRPETLLMLSILVIWSNGLIYTLEDINKRGALFAFLVSFFLILIGREALEVFGLHAIETKFSNELNRQAESLVLISLVSLFAGYALANRFTFSLNKINRENDYYSVNYRVVQNVSSILFFLTFVFNIFTVLDIVLFVLRHGYITYYTSYVSSVPYVIKKIGDMCLVCFWIFLATMPEKKQVNKLSLFYIVYLLLTLGTGQRFPFVAGILTLFVYYVARRKINPGDNEWISKKTLVHLAILFPVLIILLSFIGQVRVGNAPSVSSSGNLFLDFIYRQGVSVNVIKRGQLYVDRFPAGKSYLFGSTYEAISNNIIFRLLGAKQYAGNTADHAMNGYSFQHAISYITMGSYYEAGHGLGSCYIEEAYFDLGYIGVIVVNILYGLILRTVFDFRRHGIWATAIIIGMLNSMLLAPRGSADGFITDIVDLTTWGTIIIVWGWAKLVVSNQRFT